MIILAWVGSFALFLFIALLLLPFLRARLRLPNFYPFTLIIRHKYPPFEDPAGYPWVPELEKSHPAILEELQNFVEKMQTKGVSSQFTMQSAPNIWKVIPLTDKDHPDEFTLMARRMFGKTVEALSRIPHLFSAYFSHMEPRSTITPHSGEADPYVRVHFGVKIPAPLPVCGFQVAEERRSWEQGKVLIFNDVHRHTAFNHSDEERYILMFDVMRPSYVAVKDRYMRVKYDAFHARFALTEAPWYRKVPAFCQFAFVWAKAVVS